MALIKCSECGKEISDKATACVHCGCPLSASVSKSSESTDFQKNFADLFKNGSRGLTVDFNAVLSGDTGASTKHSMFVKELGQNIEFSVPNNIQVGQAIRVQLKDNATYSFVRFNVVAVSTKSTSTVKKDFPVTEKAAALKRRIYRQPIICLVALIACVISLFIVKFTELKPIVIIFFVGFFPAVFGLFRILYFIKLKKVTSYLEERNILGKAAFEMENCDLVPFGDKAYLSDNFLFLKKKVGLVIPCEEVLWVYTSYFRRYHSLMIGTKKWGIVTLSGVSVFTKNYKQILKDAVNELQKRKPDVLVNDTPENKKAYHQCKNI